MEPMNKFLNTNRSDFKQFVDSICAIPADRPAPIVTPSYATPIQILGRLPPTSREGFPSLPFLIDHARSFANLISIWLDSAPERLNVPPKPPMAASEPGRAVRAMSGLMALTSSLPVWMFTPAAA